MLWAEAGSSPRTRRYFRQRHEPERNQLLFSAHAEVFPPLPPRGVNRDALLRARGGISDPFPGRHGDTHSSPRTRRYFPGQVRTPEPPALFSAHAEVFPPVAGCLCTMSTLLRARGGISFSLEGRADWTVSSPRTRRYFPSQKRRKGGHGLFSAHAEVFPRPRLKLWLMGPLLRARGGISGIVPAFQLVGTSSPRTRRYFRHHPLRNPTGRLFSAHAEVFPALVPVPTIRRALLRARGGISTIAEHNHRQPASSPRTRRYCLTSNGIYPEDSSRQS